MSKEELKFDHNQHFDESFLKILKSWKSILVFFKLNNSGNDSLQTSSDLNFVELTNEIRERKDDSDPIFKLKNQIIDFNKSFNIFK